MESGGEGSGQAQVGGQNRDCNTGVTNMDTTSMNTENSVYCKKGMRALGKRRVSFPFLNLFLLVFLTAGCAHYPFNQPLKQVSPQTDYRGKYMGAPVVETIEKGTTPIVTIPTG